MIIQISNELRIVKEENDYCYIIEKFEKRTINKDKEDERIEEGWFTLPNFYVGNLETAIKKCAEILQKNDVYTDFKEFSKKQLQILHEIKSKF